MPGIDTNLPILEPSSIGYQLLLTLVFIARFYTRRTVQGEKARGGDPVSGPSFPLFTYFDGTTTTIMAVSLVGAVIPIALSILLLTRIPVMQTVVCILAITAVAFVFTRTSAEAVMVDGVIPPVVTAITAMVLAGRRAVPVAYVSGVLGILIGSDLLHLSDMLDGRRITGFVIGGAGTRDAIFLHGIEAVFLIYGVRYLGGVVVRHCASGRAANFTTCLARSA